ncbi:methyltransferase domain-containing protein [Hymenobacter sp. NBH84]|uniref:methyltransferase domain-containing protein n=1 Tax=Hymenobacter sp. NBH84 TaxID=2596915 RepID=UPI00162856D2|nr:methyltransferase domain-containing protein [Hymenobacter sp. NBH84]QNE40044.1 methyltransferase domain-containing protein [Hymenobacter sp. NBH84]
MQWNADTYTQKHAFVFQYGAGLIDLLAPQPGELILDLGCGSGELTQQLANAGAEVVGIDASAEMIDKAREQFPTLDFRVGDGASFELPERFDAFFSNAALHWMPNAAAVVRQMHRHLKPGGRLAVEFGGQGNVGQIVRALLRHLHQRGHMHIQAEWWYFPSPGEYATLLEQQGFRVQLVQHYDRPTSLADPETGLTDWIQQFGANFFAEVGTEEQAAILAAVETELRPALFQNGQWVADYKRLRVVAQK